MNEELQRIHADALGFYKSIRWRNGLCCPRCGSVSVYEGSTHYCCSDCGHRFTDTSGTIFASSKIPIKLWLLCIYYMFRMSRGISSRNLSKILGVSQPTAWRMMNKIRSVIPREKVGGDLLADELFLGPNWHYYPRKRKVKKARQRYHHYPLTKHEWMHLANSDKAVVLGIYSANFKRSLCFDIIPFPATQSSVKSAFLKLTTECTSLTTDYTSLYDCVEIYPHFKVDHSSENYSTRANIRDTKGRIAKVFMASTNPLESIFSQVRRMFHGIYHHCSRERLQLYLNEYAFRYMYGSSSMGVLLEKLVQ